jgi:hypothetical protein
MKLKIALKLALTAKIIEEKTSNAERKSLAIFSLRPPGFLISNYPKAEIPIIFQFLIGRHLFSVL